MDVIANEQRSSDVPRAPRAARSRSRRRGRLAGIALALAGIVAGVTATGVGAQSTGGCAAANGNCVMVIHIAGLEPKDVTQQTTPFLWALAHPNDPVAIAPYTTILQNRAGFTWQAPRTTMMAATAPAAAALLTGGDPRETGIPSDHFMDHRDLSERRLAMDLGSTGTGTVADLQVSANDLAEGVQTMPAMLEDQLKDAKSAAFLGDPGLADLVAGPIEQDADELTWFPRPVHEGSDGGQSGNPAYCAPPRNPRYSGGDYTGQAGTCIASDGTVLNEAIGALNTAAGKDVAYTYIQLAELGAVKQRSDDVDDPDSSIGLGELGEDTSIASTLQQTDALLAASLGKYQQDQSEKFTRNTTIFVVGDHGYETTPTAKRVPHPGDPALDLEAYVHEKHSGVALVPQGTAATVYCNSSTRCEGDKTTNLSTIRDDILAIDDTETGADACKAVAGGCIEEVLYVRKSDAPAGSTDTIADKHPDWARHEHVNVNDKGEELGPSGASGDLLVLTQPGFATGRAVAPLEGTLGTEDDLVTNPFLASSGGPRNRAIAAIVNGPQRTGQGNLRNLPSGHSHFPVFEEDNDGSSETNPRCEKVPSNPPFTAAQANANPADDANLPGHLCQLEIRDVLPTIAALMQVAVPPDQLSGRILNEAFPGLAAAPCRFDCPPDPIIPDTFLTKGPICGEQVGNQCTPQQENGRIPGIAKTTDGVNSFEFIGFPGNEIKGFDCSLDGSPWQPCSSPYTTPKFEPKTQHTFQVRAFSDAGIDPTPATVLFEIIPIFDCDRAICALKARGMKKRKLRIVGAFGNPHNLVTLSFYKQMRVKKRKGKKKGKKFRPNCSTALTGTLLPPSERPSKGKRKKAKKRCKVKTLATFAPIKIDRGELKSTLKVPKHFSKKRAPTHLGVFIEEAVPRPVSKKKVAKCKKGKKVKKGKKAPAQCELRTVGKRGRNAAGILGIKKAKKLK